MKKIFSISGKVVKGKDKGKKLGYPTANLKLPKARQLKPGVWAVKVHFQKRVFEGAAFLRSKILEVHLLNFKRNLYGKKIKVDFYQRLRRARKFKTDQRLISQIKKDCLQAKKFLKNVYRNNQR